MLLRFSSIGLAMLLLTGCLDLPPADTVAIYDHMEVYLMRGQIHWNSTYVKNRFQTFSDVQNQFKGIQVRLANGEFVPMDELTTEVIREHALKDSSVKRSDGTVRAQRYTIADGLTFVISNDEIESMSLLNDRTIRRSKPRTTNKDWPKPAFKKAGSEKEYVVPFNFDEFKELFGKPESISERFHW